MQPLVEMYDRTMATSILLGLAQGSCKKPSAERLVRNSSRYLSCLVEDTGWWQCGLLSTGHADWP